MGKKCSTVFDNKSCRSGYCSDKSGIRVISFLANIEEKTRWVMNLPNNVLSVEEVTEHMGICLNHWKKGFEPRIGPGGKPRPVYPPTEFGNTPKSLVRRSVISPDRRIAERGVTSNQRSVMTRGVTSNQRSVMTKEKARFKEKEKDTISSWEDLCSYCNSLSFAIMITENELVMLCDDPLLIEF